MEQRFDVAVYLQQGWVYLDILERTGASSATVSRVKRAMESDREFFNKLLGKVNG